MKTVRTNLMPFNQSDLGSFYASWKFRKFKRKKYLFFVCQNFEKIIQHDTWW